MIKYLGRPQLSMQHTLKDLLCAMEALKGPIVISTQTLKILEVQNFLKFEFLKL
jgi:hypothetical protein